MPRKREASVKQRMPLKLLFRRFCGPGRSLKVLSLGVPIVSKCSTGPAIVVPLPPKVGSIRTPPFGRRPSRPTLRSVVHDASRRRFFFSCPAGGSYSLLASGLVSGFWVQSSLPDISGKIPSATRFNHGLALLAVPPGLAGMNIHHNRNGEFRAVLLHVSFDIAGNLFGSLFRDLKQHSAKATWMNNAAMMRRFNACRRTTTCCNDGFRRCIWTSSTVGSTPSSLM